MPKVLLVNEDKKEIKVKEERYLGNDMTRLEAKKQVDDRKPVFNSFFSFQAALQDRHSRGG